MKEIYKILIIIIPLILLFTACSDDDDDKKINVESIKVLNIGEDAIINVDKHDTYQVKIETKPTNSAVNYYTSNSAVFTVDKNGLITGNQGGQAELIISAPNGDSWTKEKYIVNVTSYIESIEKNRDYYFLPQNSTVNASTLFTINPLDIANSKLKYQLSDQSIVEIDENGILKSKIKGIVEITALPEDNKLNIESSEPVIIYSQYAEKKNDKSNWSLTSRGNAWGSYPLKNIIDNNSSSFTVISFTDGQGIILIDMKSVQQFSKVEVENTRGYGYLKNIEIYTSPIATDGLSMDDSSFEQIAAFDFGNRNTSASRTILNKGFFPEYKKTRYLKIVLPDSNVANTGMIGEISLYNVE